MEDCLDAWCLVQHYIGCCDGGRICVFTVCACLPPFQVRADKQITIEEAPNVLTIHLKRFQYGGYGSKINRHIEFSTELNLEKFMSNPECGPQMYDLYGVLVHLGSSVHSGHYYCFVRAGNGLWNKCDDAHVGQTSERNVLAQQAYILFYVRRDSRLPPDALRKAAKAAAKAAAAGKPAKVVAAVPEASQHVPTVSQKPAQPASTEKPEEQEDVQPKKKPKLLSTKAELEAPASKALSVEVPRADLFAAPVQQQQPAPAASADGEPSAEEEVGRVFTPLAR